MRSADVRALIDEYTPTLRYVAASVLRDPDLIEDAVQDTFVKALRYSDVLERVEFPRAYLQAICRNEARTILRRQRHARRIVDRVTYESTLTTTFEGSLVSVGSVRPALEGLPPRLRTIVALRYFEDKTGPEIARALGIAEGTVKSALHRALANLRKALA